MSASENQIVVYQPNETVRLDVRLENETVWLTQAQMALLFGWDAKSLLIKFIRRARKELILIDAYPGVATLDMLAKRGRGVKIKFADLKSQIATSTIDVREAA